MHLKFKRGDLVRPTAKCPKKYVKAAFGKLPKRKITSIDQWSAPYRYTIGGFNFKSEELERAN